jgi:hypothetical protein
VHVFSAEEGGEDAAALARLAEAVAGGTALSGRAA